MKAYLELSDSLDDREQVDEILILAYLGDELLMLRKNRETTLPRARFEREEAIEKTVRRALYEQTGAFLRKSKLLGLLRIEEDQSEKELPVYVGIVNHIESPVLHDAGRKRLCNSHEARRQLADPEWEKTKDFMFYHAWKMKERLARSH